MKTIHQCLLEQYEELPGSPPSPEHSGLNLIAAIYGDRERPLVALGFAKDGHLCLGTPALIWSGPHTPDWSFKPVWLIPTEWDEGLDDAQSAELSAQAKKVATRRKRQYRRCHTCGESPLPERLERSFHGKPTCHSCMEAQGVRF